MDIDGNNQTDIIPLTSGVGYTPGDWVDNNTILFSSSIDGTNDIWQMDYYGGSVIKLSDNSESNQYKPKLYKAN
jgi:Tol biopolymer transport system component